MLEEQMQVGLTHGLTAYPHSVSPGSQGVVLVSGHSSPPTQQAEESAYGNVFARLPELKRGDVINVSVRDRSYTYRVVGTVVVQPTATEILNQQEQGSVLKLITCYPVGSVGSRLVVTAELVG
jgi:sortase A